jgi:hypothetical protein
MSNAPPIAARQLHDREVDRLKSQLGDRPLTEFDLLVARLNPRTPLGQAILQRLIDDARPTSPPA